MFARELTRVFDRLVQAGVRSDDPDDVRARKATLTLWTMLIGAVSGIWSLVYLALGFPLAGAIALGYQFVTFVSFVHFVRTKREGFLRTSQLSLLLVLPFVMQLTLGGFHTSSGVMLWAFVAPLGALMFQGPMRSIPWFVAYLALVVASAMADASVVSAGLHVPTGAVVSFFAINFGGVSLIAYLLLGYFVRERDEAKEALDEEHRLLLGEQERSEGLLLNVLPASIAARLKEGEAVIADTIREVTVLFADVVGFTELAGTSPAQEVVAILNELFSRFDELADRWRLEKIKTIGDAYMVAGGLSTPGFGHATAVAEMALEMLDATEACSRDVGHSLVIRIGIDTGPVVAGVIGRKKFAYDLWGDTVNTASRMESTGLPGQIQVTERTYDRLGDRFRFEERGLIDVKGKGDMRTYLLIGRSAPPSLTGRSSADGP
jgi:class 3 adenylate cyclase